MDRIIIGKEYKKAFESVCTLLNNGSVKLQDVNVQDVSENRIRTATHEFVVPKSIPIIFAIVFCMCLIVFLFLRPF